MLERAQAAEATGLRGGSKGTGSTLIGGNGANTSIDGFTRT
jgi:hypothetical protein